jgi:hypothetical protein
MPTRLPGPWLVGTTKVYSGVGTAIVMESLHLEPRLGMSEDRKAKSPKRVT